MGSLWLNDSTAAWRDALATYDDVVARQGVARLAELDRWYRDELPGAISARRSPHVTHDELVRLTEWKMARGVWRAPNLVLVRGNDWKLVTETSTEALASAAARRQATPALPPTFAHSARSTAAGVQPAPSDAARSRSASA